MDLRTPKGTTDYPPAHALLYEEIVNKTVEIFKVYGAQPIDTPIFELKEILLNKYGEDTKLIYDLKGETCALRYDLTVPFSRYMAMNRLKKIKRYQIGKVFRRDQPSITKGRLREFIQADFDIAGDGLPMVVDAEILSCVHRLLEMYNIGPFVIKISDRRILMAILKVAGVQENDFGTICSTIDKIDKLSKEDLNKEFTSKGLSSKQIEEINRYISYKNEDILEFLKNDKIIEECREAVGDLERLLKYTKIYGCSSIEINLSLARGLEYYTGLIIEAEYIGTAVGSVIGGGRYDNLIDGLSNKDKVPCAGFSVGISRIFSLLSSTKTSETEVFVSCSGGLFLEERMAILNTLWGNKIKAETFYTKRYNLKEHKETCVKKGIKWLVVVGQQEVEKKAVKLIEVEKDQHEEILLEDLVKKINN
ncbi:putative histidine--tRNA ligase, cytoplasmic [Nosema granulosis]|uniref:Histidine--tRNA ligase, cytoplasmic n=1 Tax=Nosema granulosis TaxID=83296 RepID=A0A9P6L0G0_9MICR|nr:putative histidine--tRNA ligase, cytoplasmic [Nosema granulosis]